MLAGVFKRVRMASIARRVHQEEIFDTAHNYLPTRDVFCQAYHLIRCGDSGASEVVEYRRLASSAGSDKHTGQFRFAGIIDAKSGNIQLFYLVQAPCIREKILYFLGIWFEADLAAQAIALLPFYHTSEAHYVLARLLSDWVVKLHIPFFTAQRTLHID